MIMNPTTMKVAVKKDTGAEDLSIEKVKTLLRRNIPCHPTGWVPVSQGDTRLIYAVLAYLSHDNGHSAANL